MVRSKLLVFSLLTFKGSMDMEGVSTAVPPSVLTSDQSDSKCLPPLSDTADRFVPGLEKCVVSMQKRNIINN